MRRASASNSDSAVTSTECLMPRESVIVWDTSDSHSAPTTQKTNADGQHHGDGLRAYISRFHATRSATRIGLPRGGPRRVDSVPPAPRHRLQNVSTTEPDFSELVRNREESKSTESC